MKTIESKIKKNKNIKFNQNIKQSEILQFASSLFFIFHIRGLAIK